MITRSVKKLPLEAPNPIRRRINLIDPDSSLPVPVPYSVVAQSVQWYSRIVVQDSHTDRQAGRGQLYIGTVGRLLRTRYRSMPTLKLYRHLLPGTYSEYTTYYTVGLHVQQDSRTR